MHNVANKKVTQHCYYAYHLFPHIAGPNTIFQSGQLFQQYVVDAWASVEQSELFWIQTNQKTIRADLYQGLRDMVEDSYNTDDIVKMGQQGRHIILPSSYLIADIKHLTIAMLSHIIPIYLPNMTAISMWRFVPLSRQ
jgi:Helitron helicase-like domain at N-terminus